MPAAPVVRAASVLLLFLSGWCAPIARAQVPDTTLSPDELGEDLTILRLTFETAHASLYRYSPKEQMDRAFDLVGSQIREPRTRLEFFRMLAPVIDRVHDAHTSMRPSVAIRRYAEQEAKVFPLDVRCVSGRAFVEKNFGDDTTIPLGGEIVSINHVPMATILDKAMTMRSADGYNRTPKCEAMSDSFWFDYFAMVDVAESFEIEIGDPATGTPALYSTAGVPARIVADGQFKLRPHDDFSLDFLDNGAIALMRIPSTGELTLADRFASAFRTIRKKKSRSLIIDIRNNGGGWDELNTELLSYLVRRPFRFYKGFTFRAKAWKDLGHVPYEPDDFLNQPELTQLTELEKRLFVEGLTLPEVLEHNCRTNPAAGIHQPKPNGFRGELYVLIHGFSGSSAGEIPALLHSLGVGTLIGEEPNAAYQGTSGGVIPKLTLPHSGISVNFPLLAYENAVLPGRFVGHGAPPHFVVAETVNDALKGRDTVLEFTLDLIAKRSPGPTR